MGRRKLERTTNFQLRLSAEIADRIYDERIPRQYLRDAVERAVIEASREREWLQGLIREHENQLEMLRARDNELKEHEELQQQIEDGDPVLELYAEERGASSLRLIDDSSFDRWLATEKTRKVLAECGLDKLPKKRLKEILRQGVARRQAGDRRLVTARWE